MNIATFLFAFILTCFLIDNGALACGVNEVYVSCINACPETCGTLVSNSPTPICLPPNPCPAGCNCIPGYVRNQFNQCIHPTQCVCADKNALVVACPDPCPITCSNFQSPGSDPCPIPTCRPYGCECKTNYVLGYQGKCVKPNFCPEFIGPN